MSSRKPRTLVDRSIDDLNSETVELARQIHDWAEPPFKEVQSARAVADYLERHDFEVDFAYPKIPTAFRAVRGHGKPVIGILGEYDALPDCGPKKNQWGHGCGHHLLGMGAAAGAVASAELLDETGRKGTIVYYGCPAEEVLAGKAYMARDGAFFDLDVCIGWHPSGGTNPNNVGGSALDSLIVEFFGTTAHGAFAAAGRSALDGAVLFDVAVNYLREHIPENVRIHSIIAHGGKAPNVVPEYAKTWYYIRGKDREQVDDVRRRLLLCAKGAATATETKTRSRRLTSGYSRLPNDALFEVVGDAVREVGPPEVKPADRKRAKSAGLSGEFNLEVGPGPSQPGRASSDQDTVSWIAPFVAFNVVCSPQGTQGHHRQMHEVSGHPFAYRGMMQAAKIFAASIDRLTARPEPMKKIKSEFRRRTKGFEFDPLIPKRQRIPDDVW